MASMLSLEATGLEKGENESDLKKRRGFAEKINRKNNGNEIKGINNCKKVRDNQ
jgi:hypothetical protein